VSRRQAAEAALVWNTIIWGATFVLVKEMLRDLSPLVLLALRFSLAAIALAAVFRRKLDFSLAQLGPGILVGGCLFTGYFLQTAGLRYTSAPKSAFITGLTSVLVPLMSSLVYRIKPQASEVLGILTATTGMALMTLPRNLGSMNPGDLLTFGCAIGFAAHIVMLGHFSGRMSFEQLSVVQIGTVAVCALSLLGWAEKPRLEWRPVVLYGILITGVLATALALTIQAWAQQHTTSTRTALIYMLEPVVAWITSFILAGEGLSARASAGAVLILGGILLVELKPLNRRLHP
jgi:drug/metabolite transporter (DMT)-like permease